MVARLNTMTPSTGENLSRFLASYEMHKNYILAYSAFSADQQVAVVHSNQLFKRELIVREAWEIGPHDIDAVAICEDDDPIIPNGQRDAPVLKTLEKWHCHATATAPVSKGAR